MKQYMGRLIAGAALLLASGAHAHQAWIEPVSDGALALRFGEFGGNLREVSPGLLDMFGTPQATVVADGQSRSVAMKKTDDGFTLAATPAPGDSVVVEDPAFDLFTHDGVTTWPRFGARYVTDTAEAAPLLTLDITPTGEPGEFRLTFKGQPLAGTKVRATVQSGWARVAYSDEQGTVHFALPWQGQYVLEAAHEVDKSGERRTEDGMKTYDSISYTSTLTLIQPKGLVPVPAGPVATPYAAD